MKVLTSSVAAAMLVLANVAFAEEPMMLSDAQMDGVSAGYADASIHTSIYGSGYANISGSLYVYDSYDYQEASANVYVNAYPYGDMGVNVGAYAVTSSYY